MATKINKIISLTFPTGIMTTSWLESQGVSRTEQSNYVKTGWLKRIAYGIYKLSDNTPTLYGALASYKKQSDGIYRIGASSALEMQGYTHYVSIGTPSAYIFTPKNHRLPKWLTSIKWDRTLLEFSTKVFDGEKGVKTVDFDNLKLAVSSPELAIMECLQLSPEYYDLMDVFYLMEMLTTLRSTLVTQLLEQCSSVKVKRLFLYMAEKSKHAWYNRLELKNIALGSGPRSFVKGGVKIAKYNIVIPKELASYE